MAKAASPSFGRHMQYVQNTSMEATKHQIENLDPREIPLFLSRLSNAKDSENFDGNHNLFILKALVRIQGRNVVPYISPFMSALLQALEFIRENPSFALHESCSWLTCSIAQYAIEHPLVPESEKIKVIGSLSGPLSDSLMSSRKNVASVCAFCLKALVDSGSWKYACSELVNQICVKVVGSLEEEIGRTGTGTHLSLAISLVRQNPLVIEPFARSLIKSGLFLLTDGGSQLKVLSVKMIHSILKCVDPRATSSEIPIVVNVLEDLVCNPLLGVNGVVFEALETAKTVDSRRRIGSDSSSPVVGLILNPKTSNGRSYGSNRDTNWETMSAKDEHLFRSSGRRVDGFGYVGSGSREHPIEAIEASRTEDIVGSGSNGWRMARCIMHDRCDRCMLEKSSGQLLQLQRIRRHNSVDNLGTSLSSPKYCYSSSDQKQQSQFCHSPEKRTGSGNLDGNYMPLCEACGGWKEQETKRRGEKQCNAAALSLVLGVFAVIFAIVIKGYLMDEDQGFPLAPT